VARSAIRGSGRGKVVSVYIIAKLEVPETQARLVHDSSTSEDYLGDDIMCTSGLVIRVSLAENCNFSTRALFSGV
jgi:hypothetical protein